MSKKRKDRKPVVLISEATAPDAFNTPPGANDEASRAYIDQMARGMRNISVVESWCLDYYQAVRAAERDHDAAMRHHPNRYIGDPKQLSVAELHRVVYEMRQQERLRVCAELDESAFCARPIDPTPKPEPVITPPRPGTFVRRIAL